jgi:hypothetical protein
MPLMYININGVFEKYVVNDQKRDLLRRTIKNVVNDYQLRRTYFERRKMCAVKDHFSSSDNETKFFSK